MARWAQAAFWGWAGLAVSPPAGAQGVISSGPATYTIEPLHFDATPAASLRGVSSPLTQDQVSEAGWWYRVAGDGAETFFPLPDAQAYTGSVATLTWNDVDARGFSARKIVTVVDAGGPSGHVESVLTLTNQTAAPLAIDVFHMLDASLAGTIGNDLATLVAPNAYIRVSDPSNAQTCEYRGLGAAAFLVREGGLGDVGSELSDADLDDFNNSGLPFGPGDFTAGFQWSTVAIPPGAEHSYRVVVAVNTPAVPVELVGFAVE